MRPLTHYFRNHEGGIATIVAIMLPAILAIGAIGLDMGYWYWDRRNMQTAADTAAVTAAWARLDGATVDEAVAEGVAMAATNGYSAADGHTVTVTVDANTGQASASISGNADLFLSAVLVPDGDLTISASAVAGPQKSGPVCILAMSPSGSGLTVNGGAGAHDIYATNCSVQANSSAAKAIDTNGANALVEGQSVCANYSKPPTGSDAPNTNPEVYSCAPIFDPFGEQLAPEWDGSEDDCPTEMADIDSGKNVKISNNGELPSGCYIGKSISFQGAGSFETDGVFFLYDSDIKMTGGAKDVTGHHITIFLYGSSTIDLEGAKSLNLSAKPSTDPDYPNILVAADASNVDDLTGGSNGDSKFGGTSTSNLEGWIYLPKQDVKMHGTGDFYINDGGLIAYTITRTGNGTITVTAPYFDSPERELVMLLQ